MSVSSYLKHDSGFEVTSRSGRLSDTGPGAASSNDFASNVNRRTSDVSTKSFDASEIIDAYGAVSPGSSPVLAQTPLPPASASDALNLDPSTALFGNVAPRAEQTARRARADSLPRGGTGDGNGGAALTKARSKSPPLGLGLGHATMVGSSSKRSVSGSASVGGVREYR